MQGTPKELPEGGFIEGTENVAKQDLQGEVRRMPQRGRRDKDLPHSLAEGPREP